MLETLAASQIVNLAVNTPGMIVGPIAKVLGVIYNSVFNFIYNIGEANALGIAIIVFTILIKTVLTPLAYKQQKSTFAMQKLQPEMEKIKKKYEKKKDSESQQKMALELQKLQKDNNVSMFGGCLPLLVQLPILYALFYIFQQAHLYIDVVTGNYAAMADILLAIPQALRLELLTDPIIANKLTIDVASQTDLIALVNQLSSAEWATIVSNAGQYAATISEALVSKGQLETFIGINLMNNAGMTFPGIIIPLAAGGTTYLSSKILMKSSAQSQSSGGGMDQAMQTMKMMNYMMPVMMGVMCVSLPAGVGLYWTISNVIQVVQTTGLNKYFKAKEARLSKGVLQ